MYRYTCGCGRVLVYKRKGDYTRAVRYSIKCSSCHKKNYALKNRDKVRQSKAKWNRANKEYFQNKRDNDLNYKIAASVRIRVCQALKKGYKVSSSSELLGCTIEEYRDYLQGLFDENMTWDNYGLYWEIDHIIPCVYFDLSSVDNQKICFHYTNTRPLEKIENRKKGARNVKGAYSRRASS